MMTILFIVIGLIVLWIIVDVYIGYKRHHTPKAFTTNPSRKSNIKLFTDGRRFFDSFITDIEKANDHIHISFYIFREDTLGKEIINLLISKAKAGVTVNLLTDYFGSKGFPKSAKRKLESNGVNFCYSAKPTFPCLFYSINRRNHRKIAIIDGNIGYFGGFNVGDEYLGKDPKLGDWRDYHLRIIGENVKDLQTQFIRDWELSTKTPLEGPLFYPELVPGDSDIQLISTNGDNLEDIFIEHINRAEKSVFIGSPYFVPSRRLQNTLIDRLDHGVEMTLLLPLKKDHPLVKAASYRFFEPLLKRGCRIFHFYQGFYHAKVFIIDETLCQIGTANFDMRSMYWNDEMNGFIYDQELIKEITQMTQRDIDRSDEVTLTSIKNRSLFDKGKTVIAQIVAPLL